MNDNGPAPWGSLPVAPQPWSGGAGWDAAQQAPFRMSPWQMQAMPTGYSVQDPNLDPGVAPQQAQQAQQSNYLPLQNETTPLDRYLPAGTSPQLETFEPKQTGGGFYPELLQPAAPAPAPAAPAPAPAAPAAPPTWQAGGQVYSSRPAAHTAATNYNNQNVADSGEWNQSQLATPTNSFLGRMLSSPQPGHMAGQTSQEAFDMMYRR